ncbi:hypothetical protein Y032_0450g1672, partial [Ancylostoma ceylanicum]
PEAMTRKTAGSKSNTWQERASYVQINIYNTSLKDLRQHGINIKNMLIDKSTSKVSFAAESIVPSAKGTKRGNINHYVGEEMFQDCLEEDLEGSYGEDICGRQLQPKLFRNEALKAATPRNSEKRVLQRKSPHISHSNISKPQPATASQKISGKSHVHPGEREICRARPNTQNISEQNSASCTKEYVNRPLSSTSYSLAKEGVIEVDIRKLLGSGNIVKEPIYKGANTSEREDENEVNEVTKSVPAGNRRRESMPSKTTTVQNVSRRIGDLVASPYTTTESEYVGNTILKVSNTPKRKRLSSSNESRAEKKDGEGKILEHRSDAAEHKNSSTKAEDAQLFECQMKGCGQKIHWRPRYGKDRILNHVRTHWGKLTKKCKLCDYKATHAHKVLSHHKVAHPSEKYGMADSLETKEDLEQLELLWRKCFPSWYSRQPS